MEKQEPVYSVIANGVSVQGYDEESKDVVIDVLNDFNVKYDVFVKLVNAVKNEK